MEQRGAVQFGDGGALRFGAQRAGRSGGPAFSLTSAGRR